MQSSSKGKLAELPIEHSYDATPENNVEVSRRKLIVFVVVVAVSMFFGATIATFAHNTLKIGDLTQMRADLARTRSELSQAQHRLVTLQAERGAAVDSTTEELQPRSRITPTPIEDLSHAVDWSNSQPLTSRLETRIVDTGEIGIALRWTCAADARKGGAWGEGRSAEVVAEGTGPCSGWSVIESSGHQTWVHDRYLDLVDEL